MSSAAEDLQEQSDQLASSAPSELPSPDQWSIALDALAEMLQKHNGCASSIAVREALEARGVPNARPLVVQLKYYDFESETDELHPRPHFRWHSHARSFYSEAAFAKLKRDQAVEADQAERNAPVSQPVVANDSTEEPEKKRNRQEESRLGTYVVSTLENLYETDYSPEGAPFVFDVHNGRSGSDYENVDLLAVHWRSESVIELVTVEVKLEFTSKLVQQARNYARFSDRVWLAVPVLADAADAATALREFDPMLFEHVVDSGLGILACRRRQGRSYEVLPVHWPRRMRPDPLEKELFIQRYRARFEEACVVPRQEQRRYPPLR